MPRNQKPNGTNAPKCDFPDLLDMRPCPTRTLQMELPFTGRTPQIGIKVPPNRQGQKGPGLHSRRLTKLLAGVLQGTKYFLSDPPKVVSSWSGRLGQCGEEKTKVSSRQRKPGQLLEQPLPYSPRQLRGSAAKMVEGVWSRPSPTAGEPWQSDLREIRQPSTPPEEAVRREIPKHPIKLSGPEGPPANDQIQHEPPGLLPKSWLSVHPCQTETQKQSYGGEVKSGFITLPGKGEQSRLVPQELILML